jgi:hypothetical protein
MAGDMDEGFRVCLAQQDGEPVRPGGMSAAVTYDVFPLRDSTTQHLLIAAERTSHRSQPG